jgi:hypothetical protein
MQNFGRGMWRRVGDFERIQVPQIIKEIQLQQSLQYKEYMIHLQRQKYIEEYRKKTLGKVNLADDLLKEQVKESLELDKEQENTDPLDCIQIPEETPIPEQIIAVETEIPNSPVQKVEKISKKGRKRR